MTEKPLEKLSDTDQHQIVDVPRPLPKLPDPSVYETYGNRNDEDDAPLEEE